MITQNKPLVSVCILAYNRPEGLKNTLKYISEQSYQNLEILVSDDCSPDEDVKKVATEFSDNDPRIKYFRQEKNLGIIGNHRFILSKISGKYMMWACDDDWWHRDYIKVCVEALEANDEVVMCTTNSELIKENKEMYPSYFEDIQTLYIGDPYVRYRKTFLNIFWWNNAFYGVFRAENIREEMVKKRFAFDYYFVLEMALQGQFIKLPPFYFKKTVGGIGNEIADNLKAIGVGNNWFTRKPILNIVTFAILDTCFEYQLSSDKKARQIYFLFKRYFRTPPMKGRYAFGKNGIFQKLSSLGKFNERRTLKQWFPDAGVLEEVNKNNIPLNQVSYNQETGKLKLHNLGIEISFPDQFWILTTYHRLRELVQDYDIKCTIENEQDFILTSGGFKVKITEMSHVYTFFEILFLKTYNFQDAGTLVVFDVGMNIGIASLFFAEKTSVKKVISFEPFEETYRSAIENFKLNPELNKKIYPNNYGLSSENKKKLLPYHQNISEYAGVEKFPDEVLKNREIETKEVEINLKIASAEIENHIQQNGGQRFVLKIDCEGCEYDIVKNLQENNILKKFSIALIEWHYRGAQEITTALLSAGFSVFEFPNQNNNAFGMIYAINRQIP